MVAFRLMFVLAGHYIATGHFLENPIRNPEIIEGEGTGAGEPPGPCNLPCDLRISVPIGFSI